MIGCVYHSPARATDNNFIYRWLYGGEEDSNKEHVNCIRNIGPTLLLISENNTLNIFGFLGLIQELSLLLLLFLYFAQEQYS